MSTTFENRKARHDYDILERREVGVMLTGWEVKAIRAGQLHLNEGWVRPKGDAWYWFGEITPLLQASTHVKAESWAERKLLMNRQESAKWRGKVVERGLTVVPLKGYFKGRFFKLEIALVRGRNQHDKRHALKNADTKRDVELAMKKQAVSKT
jgi:SsrA-binding protein